MDILSYLTCLEVISSLQHLSLIIELFSESMSYCKVFIKLLLYYCLFRLNLEKRFGKLNIDITNRIHSTCLKGRILSQFDDADALVCESKGC